MATRANSAGRDSPGKPIITLVSSSDGGNQPRFRSFGRLLTHKQIRNTVVYNVLKVAWARFGQVDMTELDDNTMAFEFQSAEDQRQIMDQSPWSVQGHCLNLKDCSEHPTWEEVDFGKLHLWIQIGGLSLDMHNGENAMNIGNSIGKCISGEADSIARNIPFLRVKIELDVMVPLLEGFWWTCKSGVEKWATIKYERLSDVCYGCGMLGHASLSCRVSVAMSEVRPDETRHPYEYFR